MKKVLGLLVLSVLAGCYVQEPAPTTPPPSGGYAAQAPAAETPDDEGAQPAEPAGAVVTDGQGVVAADGQGNVIIDDGAGNRIEAAPTHVVVSAAPQPAPGPYDNYPRVMFWPGKVNLHYDVRLGRWMTDPDGVSGAGVNILQYCRRFYPRTVSYRAYREEWSDAWRDRGNVGHYDSIKLSYLCLQR